MGPRGRMLRGDGRKAKDVKGTLKRLFSYIGNGYKLHFTLVFICIILSSVAGVIGSLFLRTLIDGRYTRLCPAFKSHQHNGADIPDRSYIHMALQFHYGKRFARCAENNPR